MQAIWKRRKEHLYAEGFQVVPQQNGPIIFCLFDVIASLILVVTYEQCQFLILKIRLLEYQRLCSLNCPYNTFEPFSKYIMPVSKQQKEKVR